MIPKVSLVAFLNSIASGLGQLREDNDANCTYEGDNNVLLQQTANWLLNLWSTMQKTKQSIAPLTPLRSASYLDSAESILRSKCLLETPQQWCDPRGIFRPPFLSSSFMFTNNFYLFRQRLWRRTNLLSAIYFVPPGIGSSNFKGLRRWMRSLPGTSPKPTIIGR